MRTGKTIELSYCNEMLADEGKSLAGQARIAAALGCMGLELAPGSIQREPHKMTDERIDDVRRTIETQGIVVTGLHWLLAPYPSLSITEPARAEETRVVLLRLVEMCARLGGTVLVHGSPGQRQLVDGETATSARARLVEFFKPIAEKCEQLSVTYCLEPLGREETPIVNTVAEACEIVDAVGSDRFLTMIDTSAAGKTEDMPVADLIRKWVPTGAIGHIQVNDTNRGAPGMGEDPFWDIVRAIRAVGWTKPVAIEPFRNAIDATATAATGVATMRAYWEAAGSVPDTQVRVSGSTAE